MAIRVSFSSGFGNQLFQYAAALILAERHQCQIEGDLSSYMQTKGKTSRAIYRPFELSELGLVSRILPYRFHGMDLLRGVPRMRRFLRTSGMCVYQCQGEFSESFRKLPARTHLFGYFQDKRYFLEDRELVLQKIRAAMERLMQFEASSIDRDVLAVHLRLGDYLKHPEFHPERTRKHIVSAARDTMDRYNLRKMMVFSDDLVEARQIIRCLEEEGIVVSYSQGSIFEDFARMANASFLLISNSTFAYWAGLLSSQNGGKVIAPAFWSDWCKDPITRLYMEEWEVWGAEFTSRG